MGMKAFILLLVKWINSPGRFWGKFWSHMNFKDNSVVVADAWDDVACLDKVAGGRKYKFYVLPETGRV